MKFRFVDLITLCFVTGVLLALTVKAVQSATEDARLTQCVKNMSTLAKGVSNYEQVNGYLPPLATANNHPGWNLRILPYMEYANVHAVLEKNRLYDKDYRGILAKGNVPVNPYDIADTNSIGAQSTFSGATRDWYRFTCSTSGTVTDAYTKNDGDGITWSDVNTALSTVAEYRCPARQPAVCIKKTTADKWYVNELNPLRFNSDQYEQSCMRGSTGDYAAGFWHEQNRLTTDLARGATDGNKVPALTFFPIYSFDADGEFGGTVKYADIRNVANTWMFGEKFVPAFAVTGDTPIANMWNGGVHRTHTASAGRILAFNASIRAVGDAETPIAVQGNEITAETDALSGNGSIRFPINFDTGNHLWGSTHPGVVNMASGDGSVQSVNTNMKPELFNNKWEAKSGVESPL